jgi:hypothetical protein
LGVEIPTNWKQISLQVNQALMKKELVVEPCRVREREWKVGYSGEKVEVIGFWKS